MGLFSRRPKVVREIRDKAWGYMVSFYKIDVDTLTKDIKISDEDLLKEYRTDNAKFKISYASIDGKDFQLFIKDFIGVLRDIAGRINL